ncbi:hypothetical protein IV203_035848 [Nitzschia inconspicua]|uniref:Uncharacterized protein n=1 Tax=Nitzschia inconspicua TaxID=303405 RepID=A0A9K3PXI9_9STRA|nr:hypothetical protein IV203_035848 [Nitzschia inconspicua]
MGINLLGLRHSPKIADGSGGEGGTLFESRTEEALPPDPVESPKGEEPPGLDIGLNATSSAPQDFESTSVPVGDPLQYLGKSLSPDCPCHNFCGDTYLGCCAYISDCPLTCEALPGQTLVAGCVAYASPPSSEPSFLTDSQAPSDEVIPDAAPSVSAVSQLFPSSECLLLVTSNENECEGLLRKAGPREDGCTCRNFCNGQEMACCELGASCPPLQCIGDFVAGCIEQNEEISISSQPSPAPTSEPHCHVEVNTQQCAKHTLTQTPDTSCDCYKYCDRGMSDALRLTFLNVNPFFVKGILLRLEMGPRFLVSVNTGECGPLMDAILDDLRDSQCSCFDFLR